MKNKQKHHVFPSRSSALEEYIVSQSTMKFIET